MTNQFDSSKPGLKKAPANREINIQNQILNFVRKERSLITIFLVSGKKFLGQVVGFDRYTIHIRGRDYDQIVFKHAITNVSVPHHIMAKMSGIIGEDAGSLSEGANDWSSEGESHGEGHGESHGEDEGM
jgi:host factor-I protein